MESHFRDKRKKKKKKLYIECVTFSQVIQYTRYKVNRCSTCTYIGREKKKKKYKPRDSIILQIRGFITKGSGTRSRYVTNEETHGLTIQL